MSDVSDLLTKNQTLCLISDRLSAEITRLLADLAAVTAERDRLREALAAEKALTNACERVNRRNDELLDQVRALREALKPFADDELHEGLGDGSDDERTHWPSFLLGDLRRAKEVYENTK